MKTNKFISFAISKTQLSNIKGGADDNGGTVKKKFEKADDGVRSDVNF